MITLQDLSHYLQELLPSQEMSDYCPNGLQVEGKKEIRHIACAVSASVAAIEAAIATQADVLIVHHGIFWNKDPYPIVGVKKKKLQLLLSQELSLFAYHLPLDAHPLIGNNWKAARDLGFEECHPFAPMGKGSLGVAGRFSPLPVKEFAKKLEAYYGHPAHLALGGKTHVSSAAIISGGAHRYLEQAAHEGVDCFITGSFDEPVWDIAHEQKINFFALGHHATERVGIIALKEKLFDHFRVPCEFIDLHNPF
jgi:dinuclear metal center YbgI/SA1388 family protein